MGRWIESTVGLISKPKKGSQLNKLDLDIDWKYPVINWWIEPSWYWNHYNTDENTITISEWWNSCWFINLLKSKFWSWGHCYSLHDLKLDLGFYYQALKYNEPSIMKLRVWSWLPNIQKTELEKFIIKFPESLDEQRTIAQILSKVDEAIDSTQALIDKHELIKEGMMHDLFTRWVDPATGSLRPHPSDAPELYKPSKLGLIPKEWEVKRLDESCVLIKDGTHFSPITYDEWKYLYITSKNIKKWKLDLNDVLYVSETDHKNLYRSSPVLPWDILLTKDWANTWNLAINNLSFEFSLLSSIAFIRWKKWVLHNEFLYYLLSSSSYQQNFKDQMSWNAIPRITLQKISATMHISPNINEQIKISFQLEQLSNKSELLNQQKQKLLLQKQWLMHDLLSGNVRVM